jgi:hypothetical protein
MTGILAYDLKLERVNLIPGIRTTLFGNSGDIV